MTRRELGGPAASGGFFPIAGGGSGASPGFAGDNGGPMTASIAWTSDDPHLSGNFAPIGPEIEAADLPVVVGRIP